MDDRLINKLESLVADGSLKSYQLVNVDENDVEGKYSENRNTERLKMVFPNGKTLIIGTFCSGSLQNTVLLDEDYGTTKTGVP